MYDVLIYSASVKWSWFKKIDPPYWSITWDHETRFSRQSLTSTVRVTQNWSLLRRPKFSRRLPVSTIYKDTSSGLYLSLFLLRFGKYVDSVRVPKWRFPHQKKWIFILPKWMFPHQKKWIFILPKCSRIVGCTSIFFLTQFLEEKINCTLHIWLFYLLLNISYIYC